MDAHRRSMLTCLVALLVGACTSPSTPTMGPPDLRGTWRSPGHTWSWGQSYTYSPANSSTGACDGELVVDVQRGSSFEGHYAIDCSGAGASSGRVLDGAVEPGGQLSFRLVPELGWNPGRGPVTAQWDCSSQDEAGAFEGSLVQDSISAQRFESLTCPPGRVVVAATFRGVRQPTS
jgi:hypothetical protein